MFSANTGLLIVWIFSLVLFAWSCWFRWSRKPATTVVVLKLDVSNQAERTERGK